MGSVLDQNSSYKNVLRFPVQFAEGCVVEEISSEVLSTSAGLELRALSKRCFQQDLVLRNQANYRHFVLTSEQAGVLGFTSLLNMPQGKRANYWLSNVCIDPRVQGRGLGRKLVKAVFVAANECRGKAFGGNALEWEGGMCYLATSGAETFFARCGFAVCDKRKLVPHGELTVMAKPLI